MSIYFSNFLNKLKKNAHLLGSVVTSFLGYFAIYKIIPEPIYGFKTFGTFIIALAVLGAFYCKEKIKKNFIKSLLATLFLLALLAIMHFKYVVKVDYNDGYYSNVLIGTSISDSELKIWNTHSDIIKQIGKDMEDIKNSYNNYYLILVIYSMLSLSFIFSFVFCLSGILEIKSKKELA
ncbi:hypothetical protein [Flavivirga eckloniae]|uniref:DUF4199 domain-containing protein n=1 Tax=Flavivirga eckloniae TaxID=1803846 RepID=A0A2K9PLQ9_9FLAO|nr:hypothetical protein [Flavivirga eckloniae]AUP78003.1 hypothetical protein C1H87_04460 [Flavivirga eckloniae]